jgi:two-component system, sensor histidine kinase ChiS
MIRFFRQHSLSRDYLHFAGIIVAIVVCIMLWLGYSFYTMQIHQRSRLLETEARKIDQSLYESFDYIFYLMGFLSNQISRNGANPIYINSLYGGFKSDFKVKDLSSWSMFDWVTPDKKIILTSTHGILAKPVDMSMRPNLALALNDPGRIFINEPDLGKISNQWIIPVSVAVTNADNATLGLINIGLTVSSITSKIEHNLSTNNLHFVLLTKDFNFVTESSINFPKLEKDFFKKHLKPSDFLKEEGVTNKALDYAGVTYNYFIKSKKFPYIIAVGFDESLSATQILKQLPLQLSPIIIIGLFSIIILYHYRKRIVTPIVSLSTTASMLASGDTDVAIPKVNSIEADNLAGALEKVKMLIKNEQNFKKELTIAHDEVKHAKATLESKVIERTSELQKALQAKTEFLNNVNHELRTPVHGVMNFSDILVTDWDQYDDKMRLKLASDIYNSSERLHSLVTNLLDLSKYKEGKMMIIPVEADLTPVVAAVMHDCRPLYLNKKDITLVLENPDVPMVGIFDKDRIMQVVRNLVSNAIKYSDAGTITARISRVEFKQGRKKKTGLQFSLSDEGKGVPENELEDIFSPFTQSTRTRTGAGGTGLGLSISKEIIEGHQGKIWAECNPGGKGMVFSFIIP